MRGTSGWRQRLQTARARGVNCFVGRQTELAILQEALAQAAWGTARSWRWWARRASGSRGSWTSVSDRRPQGWMVLDSAAVSYGQATPYGPVIDLLQRYCAVNDRDDPQTVRAKVTSRCSPCMRPCRHPPSLLALLEALPDDSPFLRLEPAAPTAHLGGA